MLEAKGKATLNNQFQEFEYFIITSHVLFTALHLLFKEEMV